jgi:acetyl-CoA carboxylase biotin carboxyl carrier protein
MDIKKLEELIGLMDRTQLNALEVEEEGVRVRLERYPSNDHAPSVIYTTAPPQAVQMPVQNGPVSEEGVIDMNQVKTVKASMVGVFYSASKPGADPFVERGSKVKKGQTLCIIEAMKLMNEIVSDYDGEIADVCVENGQMVEFGQVLFKIY